MAARATTKGVLAVLKTDEDYPHNGLSGLAWHPDGDLVFALGENFAKPWTLTGGDGVAFPLTGRGRHAKMLISELNSWPTLPLPDATQPMSPSDAYGSRPGQLARSSL